MTFPVQLHVLHFVVPAHQVFEAAGYSAGSLLYLSLRKRMPGPALSDEQRLWIIVACLAGALAGSKALAWVESIHAYWPHRHDPRIFLGGKTIAGGLAGGWAAVELVKRRMGITESTGDRFVFPIILGLSIGRIGCFLEGLDDHTYGIATSLPWGVDFGDGIRRHPTQIYEIIFCLLLGAALLVRMRRPYRVGEIFRLFILGYFSWRFAVEFIKPRETYFGLSPIQIVSFIVACAAARSLLKLRKSGAREVNPAAAAGASA